MRLLAALALLGACASAAPPPPPPPAQPWLAPPPKPDIAPPPYTVEQIRDATPPGRTYTFEMDAEGKPTVTRTIRFVSVSPTGAEVEATVRDVAGKVLDGPKRSSVTFAELHGHAHFPRAATQIEEGAIAKVPAGDFECRLYTVRTLRQDGIEEVRRFWFARDLPGAPVQFSTEIDSKQVMIARLLRYEAGRR